MARAVVLLFEDNDEAQDFIDRGMEIAGIENVAKVVGLYPIPTMVCDCPDTKSHQGGKRIVRGAKLGWWVHSECGKPVKHSYQSPKNLVDADWTIKQEPQVMFRGQVAFKYGMGKRPGDA